METIYHTDAAKISGDINYWFEIAWQSYDLIRLTEKGAKLSVTKTYLTPFYEKQFYITM